jgi:pilus assembly protein Flp/PilA
VNKLIKRFVSEERGVTALEYALIAGLIAVALVGTIGKFTKGLDDAYAAIVASLPGNNSTSSSAGN